LFQPTQELNNLRTQQLNKKVMAKTIANHKSLLHYTNLRMLVAALMLFLISTYSLIAQQTDVQVDHVVYLKDGSVYKGSVVEETDDYIYMVILDGTTIDIARWRIKKVMSNKNFIFHNGGRYHYNEGSFFWNLQLGFNTSDQNTANHTAMEFGYRLKKRWSVALGVGSEFTTIPVAGFDVSTIFNSFYLYNRNYLSDSRRRPFVYQRVGYGFGPTTEDDVEGRHGGGPQIQAGAGLHFASRKRSRFALSLGYHVQYVNGEQTYLDNFQNEILVKYDDLFVRHFILKFCLEFR
jgi:hypothetical protein